MKRKASDNTGDAIIEKLLCQRSDSLEQLSEDGIEEMDSRFEEAQLIDTLRRQLSSCKEEIANLHETIAELKEQNHLLQKGKFATLYTFTQLIILTLKKILV